MKLAAAFLLLGPLGLLVGCGGNQGNLPATVPAKGIVTLDGKPVENASVTFIADTGNYHATAVTNASGNFTLNAFSEKEGAVPGSYKIEVNKTIVSGGENQTPLGGEGAVNVQYGLPQKYSTFATSGLTHTIPDSGTTDIRIELSSK